MSLDGRYQSQELYLQQGDIGCHRGLDPLTGLAVLIYTFPARPTAAAGSLESENIPGILNSSFDDNVGQLVTAYSPQYGLVAAGESVIDDHFALEVLRAVRDAARAGVIHGDLRAGRLLYAQGHVLVEGYGVPWRPAEAGVTAPEVADGGKTTLAGDVYAIAATLLLLGGDNFSNEVVAALRGAVAQEPRDRPTATALYGKVRRACGGTITPPPRSFEELTLPATQVAAAGGPDDAPASGVAAEETSRPLSATRADFKLDLDFELDVATPSPEPEALRAPPASDLAPAPAPPPAPPPASDEPEPITLASDPGLRPSGGRSLRDSDPGFVKDLPPGATYRAGSIDETQPPAPIRLDLSSDRPVRRRSWRGPLLVVLALVAAGALASLAFLNQVGPTPAPEAASGPVTYIVAVQVQPTNLPPVNLYVVKSPSGSGTPAGTILCRAPCKVVLDRSGDWQFRGEFQNRTSKVADLKLPGPRSVTLTFPATTSGNASTPASGP